MKVDFSQETESGPVHFKGELSQDEVLFFVEYAITDLVRRGMIPISIFRDPQNISRFAEGSKELQ